MLNSLASGRRLALRITLLQLAVAVLAGLAFLTLGRQEAAAAAAGATLAALGTASLAVRYFRGIVGAGMVLGRLLAGVFLKWFVIVGGLMVILVQYKLPPLAVITGLMFGLAVNLFAFRFKG